MAFYDAAIQGQRINDSFDDEDSVLNFHNRRWNRAAVGAPTLNWLFRRALRTWPTAKKNVGLIEVARCFHQIPIRFYCCVQKNSA